MKRQILKNLCFLLLGFVYANTAAQTKFKVESLNFEGLKKTKASFLTRIAKVKAGQDTDSTVVITDIERFKRLDGVAYADYKVEQVGDAGYKITYTIKENFSIIPGFRAGQAADDSFAYRLSVFEFNGLGRNITFGGFFKKEVFNGFGVFLEHPYLFSNKLGLGVNYIDDSAQQPIFFNPNDTDNSSDFIFNNKGFETIIFYELNFKNRFEFGLRTSEEGFVSLAEDAVVEGNRPQPNIRRTAFRGSHEYVDLNIEYQNISGFRNLVEATAFNTSNTFIQTDFIIRNTTQFFKRIGHKGNFANQLQIQFSNPLKNSAFAPLIIDNQLNTRGAGNIVDRGSAIIALNSEYRYTLVEKDWFVVQGNGFLDVSGVQRPNTDFNDVFSKSTTRVYSGLGVRFIHKYIFNAVLRFDYGINVSGNGGQGFVFGIGQYF